MVSNPLIGEVQELCALGNPEVRTMKGGSSEVVDIGDLVEVATLEVAALLAKTEDPYGTKYCSGQARGGGQAQIGIASTRDDRLGGGSCDSVVGTTGDAVWEEGVAVAADMALRTRRTCWSCRVFVVYSKWVLTRTAWSP